MSVFLYNIGSSKQVCLSVSMHDLQKLYICMIRIICSHQVQSFCGLVLPKDGLD